LEKWVFGENGKKWKIWLNGWPAVGGLTGERPAVVLRWWGKRLVEVGWGTLDVREVRGENALSGFDVRPLEK
jgi:hypothetical protein